MRQQKLSVSIAEVKKTLEAMKHDGFLVDSGKRRDGEIVWVLSEKGKLHAEEHYGLKTRGGL